MCGGSLFVVTNACAQCQLVQLAVWIVVLRRQFARDTAGIRFGSVSAQRWFCGRDCFGVLSSVSLLLNRSTGVIVNHVKSVAQPLRDFLLEETLVFSVSSYFVSIPISSIILCWSTDHSHTNTHTHTMSEPTTEHRSATATNAIKSAQMSVAKRTIHRTIICVIIVQLCCPSPASFVVGDHHSMQQEQELLLLDALSKRLPTGSGGGSYATNSLSNYGSSNSIMDMLGRS